MADTNNLIVYCEYDDGKVADEIGRASWGERV